MLSSIWSILDSQLIKLQKKSVLVPGYLLSVNLKIITSNSVEMYLKVSELSWYNLDTITKDQGVYLRFPNYIRSWLIHDMIKFNYG